MTLRSSAEHTALHSAFAARVDALQPIAWERLRAHCRPLSGTTPEALFVRAQLFAMAHDTFPDLRGAPGVIRAIPVLTRASIVAMCLAYEVVTSAFPSTVDPPWTRNTSSGKPDVDRFIDAQNTIEHAMARHGVRIPSVSTAVRAAAHAVRRHDLLAPGIFERVYQWVEAEIPYEQVDPAAALVHDAAV